MTEPIDAQRLAKQLLAGADPQDHQALVDALMGGGVSSIFERLARDEAPTLLPVPDRVSGFRVRLDLHRAKPPVWRRLELAG